MSARSPGHVLAAAALALAAAALVPLVTVPARAGDGDEPKRAERGDGLTPAERVKRVAAVLERLRGKKFKQEVGVETQDAEAFRRYVDAEIDKELPPAKAVAVSKSLQAFGLLPQGYDLRRGLSDLYVSQAGAYYNPVTKKFYLLMVSMPEEQLETIILHELMHALQDQYHDLAGKLRRVQAVGNDDVTSAFQSLVEGEATFVMIRYQVERSLKVDPDQLLPQQKEAMHAAMRDADRPFLLAQSEEQQRSLGKGGDEIKRAVGALKTMPGFLFWSLHAPYFRGQYAVYRAHEAGWGAVDALFDTPPTSTEQIFHPEKIAGPLRDDPAPVAISIDAVGAALGPEWSFLHSNVLGELGVFTFMDGRLPPEKPGKPGAPTRRARVAAGWNGDRYAAWESKDGAVALVWKTTWDTEADAQEAREALFEVGFADLAGVPDDARVVIVLRDVPKARRDMVVEALRK